MPHDSPDLERMQEILAYRFVQLFTQTAIEQKMPMDKMAEAMLVEAIAILGVVRGEAGRRDLALLLRKAAETVESAPFRGGRA